MIDISPFKGFLSSLARISPVDYQIRDMNGAVIFSTGNLLSKELSVKEVQVLTHGIVDREDFQYISYDDRDYMCGIPLKKGQGVFGALVAMGSFPEEISGNGGAQDAKDAWGKEMDTFLGHLASLVEENLTIQDEIEEMAQELDQSFEDLNLYSRIASQIKGLQFSNTMLKDLIERLLENMRADLAFATLPSSPQYDVHVTNPEVSDSLPEQGSFIQRLINHIPMRSASLKENYFIINDSSQNPQYKILATQPYRFLTVRVQHNHVFYGWLGLVSFNMKEVFRQGELKLLTSLSEQLAVTIANTDLYEDLEQFVINMVKSLVYAIEAKDEYTSGHSERVSYYSMLIGKQLGLDEKKTRDLKWASILHDIGKIGIPEGILNKPDRLTDAEFEIIKGHPARGGEILNPVKQLTNSLPGIIHHHERYDGAGYPQGLKGEEIPLAGRIIAVADTFDAINSTRAYRAAKNPEEAFEIIEEVAGSQLDPHMVEMFKEVYQKRLRVAYEK
ncbi:MAG: HD domain-containing protein [Deltaproteobacteria bacterium]|nr:HD domain-containing protein [Deltaproteobacteria bacterium]